MSAYGTESYGAAPYGGSAVEEGVSGATSLTGSLPALSGAMDVTASTDLAFAASMPIVGNFELVAISSGDGVLSGTLGVFSGAFALDASTDLQLAGATSLAGDFMIGTGAPIDMPLTGAVAFGGAFAMLVLTPLPIAGTPQPIDITVNPGGASVTSALTLVILDPTQDRAPTSVQVTVGGASPGVELVFDIDGVEVWTDFADANGYLGHTAIPVLPDTLAGTRVLTVTSLENGSDSENFTLRRGPSIYPVTQNVDVDPVFIPGSTGRWVLQDVMPGGLGSWIMPTNPKTMSSPQVEKMIEATHTTAVGSGRYHLAGAAKTARAWELSGYAPNQAYQDQLKAYAELTRRIYVIDHRGRAWICAIKVCRIEPRMRQVDSVSTQNDQAGNWTMSLSILDQTWVVPA